MSSWVNRGAVLARFWMTSARSFQMAYMLSSLHSCWCFVGGSLPMLESIANRRDSDVIAATAVRQDRCVNQQVCVEPSPRITPLTLLAAERRQKPGLHVAKQLHAVLFPF